MAQGLKVRKSSRWNQGKRRLLKHLEGTAAAYVLLTGDAEELRNAPAQAQRIAVGQALGTAATQQE